MLGDIAAGRKCTRFVDFGALCHVYPDRNINFAI